MHLDEVIEGDRVIPLRTCVGFVDSILESADQKDGQLDFDSFAREKIFGTAKSCEFSHKLPYHNLSWWYSATTLAWNATVQTVAQLFGSGLRRIRKEKGLSQESLAELTGLSTNYVGEMERGLKAPGLVVIVRLARALRVTVHELLADFTDANVRRLKL